jgi:hypothetical protein
MKLNLKGPFDLEKSVNLTLTHVSDQINIVLTYCFWCRHYLINIKLKSMQNFLSYMIYKDKIDTCQIDTDTCIREPQSCV